MPHMLIARHFGMETVIITGEICGVLQLQQNETSPRPALVDGN